MAEDYKIEIPMEFTGGSKSGGKDGMSELNKSVKDLNKTVYGTMDIIEMLSSVLGDVFKILSPIFKILSIIFMMFFLPFLPIVKLLVEKLAAFAKWFFDSGAIESMQKWVQKIADLLGLWWDFLAKAFVFIVQAIAQGVIWLIEAFMWVGNKIMEAGIWIWEKLVGIYNDYLLPAWEWIVNGLYSIWTDYLVPVWTWLVEMFYSIWTTYLEPAWNFLKDVGSWIWERILKPAFEWLSDLGTWIWNILKAPFTWLKDKISSFFGGGSSKDSKGTTRVNDAIIQPNGHIIQTDPKDYLIATKNPGSLMSGGVTINFNNPVVREQADIKKIAEETSKILERKLWRSY
jgi:hypothetical protein